MTKTPPEPAAPHILKVRVYYEDTDAHGIVYHANYVKFSERGRTEYLRALGHDHNEIKTKYDLMLVIRHMEIDYHAPAKLDDLIEIRTSVISFGRTSINMKQDFYRGEKLLTEIKVVVVGINSKGKPIALPEELRQGFTT
jgi:acyl-CoA thioester hydrolase